MAFFVTLILWSLIVFLHLKGCSAYRNIRYLESSNHNWSGGENMIDSRQTAHEWRFCWEGLGSTIMNFPSKVTNFGFLANFFWHVQTTSRRIVMIAVCQVALLWGAFVPVLLPTVLLATGTNWLMCKIGHGHFAVDEMMLDQHAAGMSQRQCLLISY